MSKVAHVFPGQGAQRVGMGQDLYREFASARRIFERADETLGFPLSRLCFEGPAEELKRTVNAQPAVMVVSLACLEAAREALGASLPAPSYVAGHSLGEYTALVAAGALDLAEGVRLVRERGRLMQEAGLKQPGGMAAVLGMDHGTLEAACGEAGVEVANINCPGQVVVSGAKGDLGRVVELLQSRGGRKFLPLEVSGAFHSRWMRPAYDGLRRAVDACRFHPPSVPLVANVTAQEVRDAGSVREELLNQLCSCVQWQRSVEHMAGAGVSTFIEVGPGQVLSGLIKRITKEARTLNIGSSSDILNWRR
ncbi:MAG: ACP S-malonyltransferase [Chloroflexota bacterium]